MKSTGLFSVNEFAKLSRTTRDTLHHYDKIGLLAPVSRGENNYRYYSCGQLAVVNVIRTLQELGMSLAEIKGFKDHRAPDLAEGMLTRQIKQIDEKIENWVRARQLLLTLRKSIRSAADIDERTMSIQFLPAETIVLGDLNDYERGGTDYDALLTFYQTMSLKYPRLDLNYPVWGVHSKEQIKKGNWTWPSRYYFFNPDGQDKRPAAQYAVGYTRGGYGQGGELFERLTDHIERNGFDICGDAYEEYPLNEVSISSDTNYLIRVMITVCQKT